eukprot:431528-Prymnesium_polylepis.2
MSMKHSSAPEPARATLSNMCVLTSLRNDSPDSSEITPLPCDTNRLSCESLRTTRLSMPMMADPMAADGVALVTSPRVQFSMKLLAQYRLEADRRIAPPEGFVSFTVPAAQSEMRPRCMYILLCFSMWNAPPSLSA